VIVLLWLYLATSGEAARRREEGETPSETQTEETPQQEEKEDDVER